MLGFGVVSRLASGWICDRIGGRRTLLLGSSLQALALVLFLPFDGLVSLYVVSALFGLFQGGIVPAYAVIIREFFPPEEAGVRDLRSDRLLPGRVPQRPPVEPAEPRYRRGPAAANGKAARARRAVASKKQRALPIRWKRLRELRYCAIAADRGRFALSSTTALAVLPWSPAIAFPRHRI